MLSWSNKRRQKLCGVGVQSQSIDWRGEESPPHPVRGKCSQREIVVERFSRSMDRRLAAHEGFSAAMWFGHLAAKCRSAF
jgi:hypothetical protein